MLLGIIALAVVGLVVFLGWFRNHEFVQKQLERSLKMIPLEIRVPPTSREEQEHKEDTFKSVIAKAESVFAAVYGTYTFSAKAAFLGLKHIALEIISDGKQIKIYVVVPVTVQSLVEKAILGVYPDAEIKEVEEHNIFSPGVRANNVAGGELTLKQSSVYPIKTYKELDTDILQQLTTAVTKLQKDEGAGIQLLLRPAGPGWSRKAVRFIKKIRQGRKPIGGAYDVLESSSRLAGEVVRAGSAGKDKPAVVQYQLTPQDEQMIKGINEKSQKSGFYTSIRLIASSTDEHRPRLIIEDIKSVFASLNHPFMNGFVYRPTSNTKKLATNFIFRFFPPRAGMILNTEELATIFHLQQAVSTPHLAYAASKKVPAPAELPEEGIVVGKNVYRGEERIIRLGQEDMRRHMYVLGQTGTGKTVLLTNLIQQDIVRGGGVAVVDPHGDLIETILGRIPEDRAQDVILFEPGDLERPMGLNLFEYKNEEQKDFLVNETINMLYALYDPGHTGIVGPRMEHWLRNGALTLMADPEGASFIEVPKIFTDNDYLRKKLKYVDNSVVLDFWTKEMAQTSDFHKSEILGWFNSKFGAFASNTMMRNIIGQHKSGFDFRDVMDNKKILLVNLSKGRTGEINSRILGMIFVMKAQAAAMSRADIPESERTDFTMYVDEFQNFATDSFATILSEARKYRLSLVTANQFIGQLTDEIKNAVFGNVGSIACLRVGPDDAQYMSRQFTPVFNEQDLIQMENLTAATRLMIGGVPSKPFSLSVVKPWEEAGYKPHNKEFANSIREMSRQKYGRERELVEEEIDGFLG